MSNIELYQNMARQDALTAVESVGKTFSQSGMFGVSTPAQGAVMAMTCMMEGLTPVEFGKTYDIIKNKLSMKSSAMQAKFQERGGRIKWIRSDAEVCEASFVHKDYAPDGVTIKVSLSELVERGVATTFDDKKKEDVLKDNYRRHPAQMLRARAVSEGIRMVDPSIVSGIYTPEEISDFDDGPKRQAREPLLSSRPEEPLETDARVIDESPSLDLSEHEDSANLYLRHLGWIVDGQTWRDLPETRKKHVMVRLSSFLEKMHAHFEKETAHVG